MPSITQILTTSPGKEILTSAGTVFIMFVGAWVNHALTQARFSSSKIWEKRLEANSSILVALGEAETRMATIVEGLSIHGERLWHDKGFQERIGRASEAVSRARKTHSENALIMSGQFANCFLPPEEYEKILEWIKDARPELDKIARKEIQS